MASYNSTSLTVESTFDENSKDLVFDQWFHFTDPEFEKEFRAFSLEDCRQKMLTILVWSSAALFVFCLISVATLLAGTTLAWDLGLRASVLAILLLAWVYCHCSLWRPWHFHFMVVVVVLSTLTRMVGSESNPFYIMMAPMARAITCTASMHEFTLSVVFNSMDILLLMAGGHYIWPDLPFDISFAAPFVLVYFAGLVCVFPPILPLFGYFHFVYLQFYVERMDRRRWHAERGLHAKVAAENKLRLNTETMLRFISHEVRNPQNAIALSADSLLMEAQEIPDTFSPDHIRIFEIIRCSSEFITALLEDVLNFQRLSDGKVALTMQPFCPMEFLTNMAHSLSIVLGSKKIEFLTHVDPRLAAFFCEGDKHRIQQVVSNFVSNAAKFTPVGGQVKMTAMLCQSDDSLQPPSVQSWIRIRIAVKDSGIGISEADQKLLFQTFSQINPGKNQAGKGMGLGLNISKGLVELHGGEIGVKSVEGQGAEFFCEIPFCVVEAPESSRHGLLSTKTSSTVTTASRASHNSHGSSIVASNVKVNSPLLRTYSLKRSSISAHMISPANGVHLITPASSVDRTLSAATDTRATMQILMEEGVEMSELHGPVEVDAYIAGAEAISESEILVLNHNVFGEDPISQSLVCITGAPLEPTNVIFRTSTPTAKGESVSAAVGSSYVGRVLTPVPLPVVRHGISFTSGLLTLPSPAHAATSGVVSSTCNGSALIDRTSPSRSGVGSVSKSVRSRRSERVLAADDQKFVRDILERSLTQLGFDCVMVASGEDAIETVKADLNAFALIFLDMNMGGITGVETTMELRRLGCTAAIVGLTGDDTSDCREQFRLATAERVLTKPLRLQKLNEVLMELLPLPPEFPNETVVPLVRKPTHVSHLTTSSSHHYLDGHSPGSIGTPVHFGGIVTPTNMLRRGPRMSSLRLGTVHCYEESDSAVIDICANIRVTTPIARCLVEREFSTSKTTVETSNTGDVVLVVSEKPSEAVTPQEPSEEVSSVHLPAETTIDASSLKP